MIERKIRSNFLPASRRVAMLARFLELAAMRIHVTRRTGSELHVFETRGPTWRLWLVAFLAGHLKVQSGQRVPRFGVIELLGSLPIGRVMTAGTILAKLSFVYVLVATDAFLRHPHVGFRQIPVLNQTALFW